MKTSFFRKIITFVSIFSIVAQSLTPYALLLPQAAYAQETPVVEETTPPAETPVPTTEETQPTETVEATPTPSETVETTPTPTEDPSTITPTPTDNLSPPTSNETTTENSNSSENTTEEPQPSVTTSEETVIITPEQEGLQTTGTEELSLLVLDNVSAPSIDLEAVEESGSAALTTDKPDYAPTDTALITGTNLLPNTEYLLKVWSDDEPPTGVSAQVISDDNGVFAYAYQLDGTYRPNYSAELRDSEGNVVAVVTFTDSHVVTHICTSDAQGANDEPGQKDLTRMCFDSTNQPTSVFAEWNWDDVSWPGGNTGDACALFDTDNDGNANYATCVTVTNNPAVQAANSPRIYSCGDTRSDRCTSDSLVAGPYLSTCTVAQQSTQPFPTGDSTPTDTNASCTIRLSEVGGGTAQLIDTCSYPSQQPNSDPSDCIFAKAKSGKLEVVKVLTPAGDSGLFNLQIDGITKATNVSNGGTTSEQVVSEGNHTVGETQGTSTLLSNYSATIVCKNLNGTGSTIASSSNSGPLTVSVADGSDIVCTITNTRINNGSITIVKDAQPNDSQDFSFTTTGLSSFSLDDDSDNTLSNTKLFSNLASGTYSVSEGAASGWTQASATCTDGSPVTAISLQSGENVTCTFTNTQDTGTITVNKTLIPNNDPGKFNLQVDGNTAGTGANAGHNGTTGAITVLTTGTHTVSEIQGTSTLLSDYTTTYSCNNNLSGNGTSVGPFSITKNQNVICTFTNTRNTGSVLVNKLLDNDGNGTFETSNPGSFNWSLDTIGSNAMGSTVNGVNTGNHNIDENSVSGYHFVGWYLTSDTSKTCANTTNTTLPASIAVTTGQTTNITLCNQRDTGTVVVHKDVQGPAGEDIVDTSNNFTVQLDAAGSQVVTDDGTATYNNVPTGNHTVTESVIPSGYTLYGISQTQGNSGNLPGLEVSVTTNTTTHVYVTNRQQTGTVTVVKDVLNPDSSPVSDSHSFTTNLNPGNQSDSFAEGDNAVFTVNPGTYTVTENDDPDYSEQGCKLVTGADATGFNVAPGAQVTVTCTNLQKKATINVTKDVLSPTNGALSDNHAFTAQLNGGSDQSFSEATTAAYLVNPGDYSITELPDNNYDYVSCTPDTNQTAGDGAQVTVASNGQVTVTCVNKQKNAQVTVVKDVRDPNGANVTDNTNFVVQRDGSGTDDKDFRENLNAVYTLAPGTYTFAELVTAGYTLNSISDDNDANVNNGTTVTLNSGENKTITFTNYQNAGSISGQKLNDVDGSLGTTNDQTNLSDWVIELYSCSSDFVTCVFAASDTTDGTGYSFLNLVPGYYQVREILQGGWTNLTSLFQNFTVTPGENETNANFVNFQNVSVTACKVEDADGDVQTTNDQTPVLGWTINLLTDGQISDTQVTDGQGRVSGCYTWTNLGPNHTYSVQEVVPSNWTALSDTIKHFGTAQGGSQYNFTFVNFKNVSISGHKFNDLNGDGVWDDNEPPLSGWTINLSGAGVGSDVTDGNGEYSFTNLGPGTYTLGETQQSGWTQTAPNGGTFSVTTQSGTNVTDKDFGNQGRGSLTVHKLVDRNGDGTFEDSDPSDFNWSIDESGTNAMGSTVSNVPAGLHNIDENSVSGYHFVGWYSTGSQTNSCANPESTTLPISVNVGPGGTSDYTLCNQRDTGTVVVTKYLDDDADGFMDEGEEVLSDWTMNLSDNGSQVTDISGQATFSPVTTGSYTLSENIEDGWNLSNIYCSNDLPILLDNILLDNLVLNSNNGVNSHTVNVTKDDTVNCYVGNYEDATIIVVKDVVKANGDPLEDESNASFAFNIDEGESFNLKDGESNSEDVTPGTHNVTELEHELYDFGGCSAEYDGEETGTPITQGEQVTVGSGDEVTVTCVNKQKPATLTIVKDANPEGDQSFDFTTDSLEDTGTNLEDFSLTDNGTSDDTKEFEDLNTGTYIINEEDIAGWNLTNISCGEKNDYSVNGNELTVTLGNGEDVTCTFSNEKDGKVIVTKYNDRNQNGVQDENEEVLSDWDINLDEDEETTNENGQVTFDVQPGEYVLSEDIKNGWEQTNISCNIVEITPTPTIPQECEDEEECVTPTPTPNQNICHLNEGNNPHWNAISVSAAGATSHLANHPEDYPYAGPVAANGHPAQGGGADKDNPDEDGEAWCAENAESNQQISLTSQVLASLVRTVDAQSNERVLDNDNNHPVNVEPGQTVNCTIGNRNLTPVLTISKENDAVGNKAPNDNVTYTITLTLDEEGGPAENLEVTDLLPKGFVYNSGSWQVLLNGSPIVVGEPTYASPGTWTLGSADPGDVFTLIYTAKIDGSQQTGTYYDNAWGQGTAVGGSDVILASAVNPGQLDSTFVGTEVALVNPSQPGVDYKATSTKEVLGASTFLPATGENTLWVIIATLMLGLGFGTAITGYRLKKKYE